MLLYSRDVFYLVGNSSEIFSIDHMVRKMRIGLYFTQKWLQWDDLTEQLIRKTNNAMHLRLQKRQRKNFIEVIKVCAFD